MKGLIKNILVLSILLIGITACNPALNMGLTQGAKMSADIADHALTIDQWGLCEAATVGAIRRKFGNDPVKIKAWQDLCAEAGVNVPPKP